ncbi:MAG: metallopeptidase family protein [Myxococcota bacterium]|nr:metallopeptidase family protein [Myxococcota bacterium]
MTAEPASQELVDLLQAAESALADGRPVDAEKICRSVVNREPQHAEAQYLLAEALRLQGRVEECELTYRACVLSHPEHSESWAALASMLFEQVRWEEARRAANRSLREDPYNPEAAFVRGALRERRDDYAGAHRDFLRAWRSSPRDWPLPVPLEDEVLESVVEEAIHLLHPTLRDYLANVAIILEDYPAEEVLLQYDPPAAATGLLGYFSGASLMDRAAANPWSNLPSAIVIYRRNIERMATTKEEIIEQLCITFFHEVGHFLGLSEEDLVKRDLD